MYPQGHPPAKRAGALQAVGEVCYICVLHALMPKSASTMLTSMHAHIEGQDHRALLICFAVYSEQDACALSAGKTRGA